MILRRDKEAPLTWQEVDNNFEEITTTITEQSTHTVNITTENIDCSEGNYFKQLVNSDITYTFTNVPVGAFVMVLEVTNGGDYIISWPLTVKWANATAPTLTSGGVDVLTFITYDSGITWRGVVSIPASA